jgi:hypothetical protein
VNRGGNQHSRGRTRLSGPAETRLLDGGGCEFDLHFVGGCRASDEKITSRQFGPAPPGPVRPVEIIVE